MKILQSIPYPTYTTAQRDALVGVLVNYKINNSDTGLVEEWNGSTWVSGAVKNVINSATNWNGTLYNIDLSSEEFYKRTINNGVSTLTFGLSFPSDASTYFKKVNILIDNSTNSTAISTITFTGGTWQWDVGVQPSGLAANSIALLTVTNMSNTEVSPIWTVRA